MEISKRAEAIEASITLAISARAKQMQESGIKVINFTVGEPDFNTPDYIITAAKTALDRGHTKYTAVPGILPLRKAICDKLSRDNGLNYTPNQIVVANGAKQALANTILALINPGDEVLIPSPHWITYPELVKLAGGVPVYIQGGADFKITAEQLKSAITPKTKALIINSPNNPTGAVYTETELREFAKVIASGAKQSRPTEPPAPIWVISDEIYENLIYNNTKNFSIATVYPQTVVINGFSKTYSMTGWRIGYSASPENVAVAIDGIQSHLTSNVNTMTQHAAIAAFDQTKEKAFLAKMVTEFKRRRDYMASRIKAIGASLRGGETTATSLHSSRQAPQSGIYIDCQTPDGAFYVMVKTNITAAQLLDHANMATVPGEAFGAPGYIRFCYTVSMEDIIEGMNRLEKYVTSLLR
jgi:aspartate aminotransferase